MSSISVYRYIATSITTGKLVMADIPLAVSAFNTQISGAGALSGSLTLRSDMPLSYQLQALAAVEPWAVALWVLCDNQLVWGGPVTAISSSSVQSYTLDFTAATWDALFQYRIYDVNTNFVGEDVGLIFYETINYALNKKLPYSQVPSLNYANKAVGVKDTTFSIDATDYQDVQSIWNSLVTACDVEYCFATSWNQDSTAPMAALVLAQTIGRPLSANSLNFVYPSTTVYDYGYYVQNSQSANHVIATGTTADATPKFFESATGGFDLTSLGQGHTLLEQTYSAPNTITSQADVDSIASTMVKTLTPLAQLTPSIILAPNAYPHPYEIQLGDWAQFTATSALHPPKSPGGPGLVLTGRVTNISVVPAQAGQTEQVTLTLGQCVRSI